MILATKLFVPQLRLGLVQRPLLAERVRLGLARPLTLIAAPAGFGKTTLLVQALTPEAGAPPAPAIAWLALDADDNAPLRFWLYVAAALDRAVPGLGAAAQARLHESPPPDGQELAAILVNAAAELPAPQRVLLALDDYQLITAQPIHEQLSFLIDHLPLQMRVALLTRVDPPLALSRRRARGELSEFRAADLRFRADETGAFFQHAFGITLTPELISALEQRTEGWAAGIQLAALALEHEPGGAAALLAGLLTAERNLLDYLADEVFAGLDPAIQAFLLRTAILDRLSAPLCATILNISEGEAADTLRRVERAGLFLIALDAGGEWYRYHHLFAELLRARLRQELPPPAVAELHRYAAVWHGAHGAVEAAIDHALQAGAPDLAAAAVEVRYLSAVRRVDSAALASWLAALPPQLVAARPRLKLADAWRALLELDLPAFQRTLPWLTAPPSELEPVIRAEAALLAGRFHLFSQQAEAAQSGARAALAELPADALFLRGLAWLNLGLAQRLAGDLPAAETALAEAAVCGHAADDASTFVSARIAQANTRQVQGDLRGAAHLFRQMVQQMTAADGARLPLAELALINLGWLYAEQNRLDAALTMLEDGLALAQRKQGQRGILDGSTFLALTYAMQGDRAGVERCMATAHALAERVGPGVVSALVAERHARAQLLLGDWAAARDWALRVDPQQQPDELAEDALLTYARFKLAESEAAGDHAALQHAREVALRLSAAADASGRTDRRLRALALHAVAEAALHNETAAFCSLRTALSLAAPGGFVRVFLNHGPRMRGLIERYCAGPRRSDEQPVAHSYAEQILAAFGTPAQPTTALSEPLTDRELEVLTLIAAGHSNAAIAEQLIVAITTVKAHLRNIFGKLDVGSRTQAVARAQALGLIGEGKRV